MTGLSGLGTGIAISQVNFGSKDNYQFHRTEKVNGYEEI